MKFPKKMKIKINEFASEMELNFQFSKGECAAYSTVNKYGGTDYVIMVKKAKRIVFSYFAGSKERAVWAINQGPDHLLMA